ncbi:MAG: glycosyltransferase family 2 protein [Bacteroidia bacterium]|nr:glycosyltransferase family 2 protein [Bacteroidia bacterium]
MYKLSTVIMTFNEEEKIERCINSVSKISDEVIVLDSHSTDKTVDIAKTLGAIVYSHDFLGYIKQRELSISKASHNLVLALDADEFLSVELQDEIAQIKTNPQADAYYLNRSNAINNYFLKHGSWFPHRIIRLFIKGKVKCIGNPPHDRIEPLPGIKSSKLKGLLMHHCNEDIHDRMTTVNNHSTIAAEFRFSKGIKSNYFRVIIKPIWKFIVEYFLRLGFMDGFYGYLMAKTTAHYIYLRESKLMELTRMNKK